MKKRIGAALTAFVAACACVESVDVSANPLDEHRSSMRLHSRAAYSVSGAVTDASGEGRIEFNIPSARFVSVGVRSGDQVAITIGNGAPLTAHVEFRDEIDRDAKFYLQEGRTIDPEPGMTLVIDRDQPGRRIVLDASTGGISPGDAVQGWKVTIDAVRRVVAE